MIPAAGRTAGDGKRDPAHGDVDPEKFPNLAAEQDWDREQHIKQAMQAGMTRKQAERHADDELRAG